MIKWLTKETFWKLLTCTDQKIGRLWCSTKTDPVTYEHVSGGNHYGFCEEEHCPGLGNCQVIQQKDQKLKPCQFPFITEDGTNHHDCTNYQDPTDKFWCSTKTDPNTFRHIPNQDFWGYCEKDNCPDHLNGKNYTSNDFVTVPIKFPGHQNSSDEGRIGFENQTEESESFKTVSGDPEVLLLIGGKTPNNDYLNNIELLGRNDCAKIPM